MTAEVQITRAGVERIDDLEPMAHALFETMRPVDPGVPGIPMRDQGDIWPRRKAMYLEFFAEAGTFILIAESADDGPVGYAFVVQHAPMDGWDSDGPLAEVETLVVLPQFRDSGIGERLMDAVYAELRSVGIHSLIVGVLATNEGAIRFYEHLGLSLFAREYMIRVPAARERTDD